MKRDYTFELKNIHTDYNTRMPKDLEKRLGKCFKLIGEITVGKGLMMYFEDGYEFKTTALDLWGYIKQTDDEGKEVFVTLCTKDLAFEMDVVNKNIKVNVIEQLTFGGN